MQGLNPRLLRLSALAGGFFMPLVPPGKPLILNKDHWGIGFSPKSLQKEQLCQHVGCSLHAQFLCDNKFVFF